MRKNFKCFTLLVVSRTLLYSRIQTNAFRPMLRPLGNGVRSNSLSDQSLFDHALHHSEKYIAARKLHHEA
jgi:hypothetical protein